MIWPFSNSKKLTQARQKALEAVKDAERRRDTRDFHLALERARQATTAALRAELGR